MNRLPMIFALAIGAPAAAQDAIDLATVTYHISVDVHAWLITKTVTQLQLGPGASEGVRLAMTPYVATRDGDTWPDFIAFPPDGHLRYTLWIFVRMSGAWHGAAVHEFWYDR